MVVERENILSLIGSRRYHSCILTTFSFDFYFFEMKAMKWLRSCGVRNINVFIDGHFYSELMQQATGEEMQLTPGYSIYPVFHKSIFHPKIWMLFGEKEGLLIVGSGNLTNSGNGNNDEIWGAFHFDIRSIENTQIFSSAWNYLSVLSSSVKGQMNEKTSRWIVEHSKWLRELPSVKQFAFLDTSQKEKVAFLYNSENSSIWEELSKHIIDEKIIEISTISPYYDKNGKVLQELKVLFPLASINVVIDESGSVPYLMEQSNEYTFYDWRDVGVSRVLYSKSENSKSKLHGKIIHFKTKSGKEFCLFGSANVTPEGLGLSRKHSNAEVSLLIQSEKGDMLKDLGILLKSSNNKKLSDFNVKNSKSIYETVIKNNQFKVQLVSAEIMNDELTFQTNGTFSEQYKVVFFDKKNRFFNSEIISNFEQEQKLKLNVGIGSVQYIQLADNLDNFISNKLLVSDYLLIAKTHPNPKTEDIERIYSEIQNGELSKVLDLLHYAIIDETENEEGTSVINNSNKTSAIQAEKQKSDNLYDLSTYKPIEHSANDKNLLLTSLSLRVLDVLKSVHTKSHSINKQYDISDDEQEENIENISGNEENEVKTHRNLSFEMLKSEKRKLLSYFDNVSNNQKVLLYGNNRPQTYKPTLTDLSKYLIVLELIFEYGGKSVKYDEQDRQHFFSYLPFNEDYKNTNIKGCSLNLVGDFLMLARTGFKEYDFEYTKNKVEELKIEALVSTIVCLLNNRWNEKELHYFYTLLLNTLHYLGWKEIVEFNNNIDEFKTKINNKVLDLKYTSNELKRNLDTFYNIICPAFCNVLKQISIKNFNTSTVQGKIIYKSPWGYCYVQSVTKTNEFVLCRPGFIWDSKRSDFIKYSSDEVYQPLKLNSFITVDFK